MIWTMGACLLASAPARAADLPGSDIPLPTASNPFLDPPQVVSAEAQYTETLRQQLGPHWAAAIGGLPPRVWKRHDRYALRVAVAIGPDGAVEAVSIPRSSGARPVDALALGVFRAASPLPPPPPSLLGPDGRAHLRELGFALRLPDAGREPAPPEVGPDDP